MWIRNNLSINWTVVWILLSKNCESLIEPTWKLYPVVICFYQQALSVFTTPRCYADVWSKTLKLRECHETVMQREGPFSSPLCVNAAVTHTHIHKGKWVLFFSAVLIGPSVPISRVCHTHSSPEIPSTPLLPWAPHPSDTALTETLPRTDKKQKGSECGNPQGADRSPASLIIYSAAHVDRVKRASGGVKIMFKCN